MQETGSYSEGHAQPGPIADYTAMEAGDMLRELGDDASKWAAAFNQYAAKRGHPGMDEGWLIGWFANAIEHSHDVRHWRAKRNTHPSDPRLE